VTDADRGLTVLVVGSGGREHALAWACSRSARCDRVLVAPGNGGTPGVRVPVAADDVAGIVALCRRERVDLVVVGPEAALAAGLADALADAGVACFGPVRSAARLESSKAYGRAVADRLGIPGPVAASFTEADAAIAWWRRLGRPVVVKQSGLAAGKGVLVPENDDDTLAAIRQWSAIGEFVLEERLHGPECSLLAFCDGATAVPMVLCQDHKRIGDGDTGPNTGGMGAYAPAPVQVDPEQLAKQFVQPVVDHLRAAGTPYVGVLYAGLMLTADGPRLIEYNCRFGDPEAQAVLPLLTTDLVEILLACCGGRLRHEMVGWRDGAALTVVAAAPGYPDEPRTGQAIDIGDTATPVFYAGCERGADGVLRVSGGRVLAVTGTGRDLAEARERAYAGMAAVSFEGMHVRRDIGWRAPGALVRSYAQAGVDIDEGNRAVALMKASVQRTHTRDVLQGVGAFGGALDVSRLKEMAHPVLVASTDGVGTKVELAARTGRYAGVGIDIVNHCINDVLVQGARPLFFLDYIASSALDATQVSAVVGGMALACEAAGCVLLGGETAEMPGVYQPGAFDIAGTLVGVVDRADLLPREPARPGDVLVGLASSGPHTNGYSLLRRVFEWIPLDTAPAGLDRPLVDALLEPHRSYLPVLEPVLAHPGLRGLAHITGGGLEENVPRALPPHVRPLVELDSWPIPPLFSLVRELASGLDRRELYRTLNMGVGMVLVCAPEAVDEVRAGLGEESWIIGEVVAR
jgi:phosphoribosylamine--glycine ligase/phosphoribosylaminoimidazole synthetase